MNQFTLRAPPVGIPALHRSQGRLTRSYVDWMEMEFKIPEFKTEAEEARWWSRNQVRLANAFKRAADAGRLHRGTVARKGSTPTTTIRLHPSDIERAKTQAQRRGLKYQTYLKMLIHEALQSEEQKAG